MGFHPKPNYTISLHNESAHAQTCSRYKADDFQARHQNKENIESANMTILMLLFFSLGAVH